MNFVKIKTKGQVTIPAAWRQKVRMKVGDILKVTEHEDKLVLTPQSIIDRRLAESMEDIRQGRVHSFKSMAEALDFLDKRSEKSSRKTQ